MRWKPIFTHTLACLLVLLSLALWGIEDGSAQNWDVQVFLPW